MSAADIEVHRVYCTVTQRVQAAAASLHPEAAYIVMDNKRKDLGVWVGQRCRQVDRRIAENIGATIKHDTYKKATAANHIVVSEEPAVPAAFFLGCFSVTASQFKSAKRSKSIVNDTIILHDVEIKDSDKSVMLKLNCQKTPREGGSSKLEFTGFDANKAFLLQCGPHECYLWVGGRVAFKDQKIIKAYMKNSHLNYEYVHEKMEPLLFKNKFLHVKEAFDRPSSRSQHNYPMNKTTSLPPIDSEVKRMVDENFGTLRMVSGTRGQLGDCLRQGLLMDFIHDESGVLTLYRVNVSGTVRSLVECFPSANGLPRPVVFSQSGAYAALYVCKNGARGLVYLWVGDLCPPDVQAALALRCKEIIPPGIGADQLQLQQGREPALLLGLMQTQRSFPLCILHPFEMPGGGNVKEIELCLEVSTIPIKLRDTAVQVVEISKTQAAVALSPFKARLFVTVKLTPPTSSSSNYTAKKIKVDIKFGSLINNQVKEAARSVASKMTEILTIQQSDAVTVLENKVRRHARSVSMDAPVDSNNSNSPQDRGRSVSTASAGPVDIGVGDAITIPATLVPVLSEKSESNHGVTIISGLRPVRLFQVSHIRRSVGGIFVEEIGIGGVFVQTDLSRLDCYILDAGGDLLYIWIGSECMYRAMALVTRVVRSLKSAMIRVTSPLQISSNGNNMLGDYFKMPPRELRVEYIRQYDEPPAFTQLFKIWKPVIRPHNSLIKNVDVVFTPESIPDDESLDAERGDDGRLLSETSVTKPRYSETVEYKRHSSPVVAERKTEDFRGVSLKTTPQSDNDRRSFGASSKNSSPLTPHSLKSSYSPPPSSVKSDTSNEQRTPEFVQFRKKLRPVENSPIKSIDNSIDSAAVSRVIREEGDCFDSVCCCLPFISSRNRRNARKGRKHQESDDIAMRNTSDSSNRSSQYVLSFKQNSRQALLS